MFPPRSVSSDDELLAGSQTTRTSAYDGAFEKSLVYVLIAAIAVTLGLQFLFVFRTDMNWDEFYYLSQVYEHRAGSLSRSFQTFHVHLFGWLTSLDALEPTQILLGRLVTYLLHCFNLYFIFAISRKYTDTIPALAAVACYCAFSFVMDHSASFRSDPFATFTLMAALYISICFQWRMAWFLLAGVLIGVAGLITIKSIFLALMIGAVMLVESNRSDQRGRSLIAIAVSVAGALVTFGALYLWHKSLLAPGTSVNGGAMLKQSFQKTILDSEFFPRSFSFLRAVLENIVIVMAVAFGLALALRNTFAGPAGERKKWLALVLFASPLLTLLFYRNAFPYYYAFMLAPVAVLASVSVSFVLSSAFDRDRFGRIVTILLVFFSVQVAQNVWRNWDRTPATQIATIETIHKMFDEPVGYIDRNSMIASFPKHGFFMSSWGFENYHAKGVPVMGDIIRNEQPKFLIANTTALDIEGKRSAIDSSSNSSLLPQDVEALKANYVHHWGNIYVAGKQLLFPGGEPAIKVDLLIEGTYTLEANGPVTIDGILLQPGSQIFLNRGEHIVRSTDQTNEAVLRWGKHLYMPDYPAPTTPIFFGF